MTIQGKPAWARNGKGWGPTNEAQLSHDGGDTGRDHAQVLSADQHVGGGLQHWQSLQCMAPPQAVLPAIVVVIMQPRQRFSPVCILQISPAGCVGEVEALYNKHMTTSSAGTVHHVAFFNERDHAHVHMHACIVQMCNVRLMSV